MAWYDITYSCGHAGRLNLIGKVKDRERRIEWLESSGECPDCFKARKEQERQAKSKAAKQAAIEQELPILAGTPKQVAWAERLRQECLTRLEEVTANEDRIRSSLGNDPHKYTAFLRAVESIYAEDTARWWIDNQREFDNKYALIGMIKNRMLLELNGEGLFERKAAEQQAAAERLAQRQQALLAATVRPEKAVTETVAEILISSAAVEVIFPEKRDDFRLAIKALGYTWGGTWRRGIGITSGSAVDRAAEAGNVLLAAGFIVAIYDETARAKAVAGDFEPLHTRWIAKRAVGKYAGWFTVQWQEDNESLYRRARNLPRSRWDSANKQVVVPSEMYREVLDFAGLYGFKLTPGALKLAEAARETKEAMLIAAPAKPAAYILPAVAEKPAVLSLPSEVEIDASLRDENDA